MRYPIIVVFSLSFLIDSLVGQNPGLMYYAAQAEPDTNWFMPEFDDSGWVLDTGAIGFGNLFEEVTIPTETKSLYIRYKLEVTDPTAIKEMNFMGDYDDGYIAYINGKEILRVNISDSVKFPAYDDVTVRSHEMERFTDWPVYGYYLDTLILDTCLVTGENIIAVHVLNDSLDGSDLHYSFSLYDLTGQQYNIYYLPFRYKRQYFIDSVSFPLVIIETDEFGIPYKNQRVKAFMGIIDNGPMSYNKPTDSCNVFYGDVSIEVRGQSSSEFPKRSYRFELKDSLNNDSNVVLLGMPSNDDWILYGPFQDKAQFRNPMVFDLARHFRRYQPRTRYCEVILNGEAVGLYSLTESIKRGKDRIDIQKLEPSEISGNDITGGYIMKYDKNDYNEPTWQIIYPKKDDIQPEQVEYITGFMNEYHSTLFKNNFRDLSEGYRKYMSDTTLVDYMIMTELTKNCDGYVMSTYFYKDRADKDNRIKYGPLWDNDLAFGNTIFHEGAFTDGWHFDYPWQSIYQFMHITRMLQDTAFVHLFQNRWFEARQKHLHTDSIMAYIDFAVNYLHDAVERNYYVWPVIDKSIFWPNYISQSYDEEIWNIKNWLSERLEWIDNNIADIYYDVDIYPGLSPDIIRSYFGFEVFPNPFDDELLITFSSSGRVSIQMDIYDLSGHLKYSEKRLIEEGLSQIHIENSDVQRLLPGIYILKLTNNDGFLATRKLVKQ